MRLPISLYLSSLLAFQAGKRFENLRHDMFGRDEVDVVTPLLLQLEHHPGQLSGRYLVAFALLARFIVLTEYTAQVAPAEKDRAGAMPPADDVLLAEMREIRGHARIAGDFANRVLLPAVYLAIARAKSTGAQALQGLVDFVLQRSRFMALEISRRKVTPRQ